MPRVMQTSGDRLLDEEIDRLWAATRDLQSALDAQAQQIADLQQRLEALEHPDPAL